MKIFRCQYELKEQKSAKSWWTPLLIEVDVLMIYTDIKKCLAKEKT